MLNLAKVMVFSSMIVLSLSSVQESYASEKQESKLNPNAQEFKPKQLNPNAQEFKPSDKPMDLKSTSPEFKPVCSLPLLNSEEAKRCVEHDFQTRTNELFTHAQDSGHLGDTSGECGLNTKGVKESYFSSNQQLFFRTLHDARVKCQLNNQDITTFFCLGETTEDMCYIDGHKVKTLRAVINKNTGHMVSFSPSQYGSDHIK